MDNRILIGAITAVVVVVMLGGVLMPVIDDATTGKSESNPDAGWIRMNYDTAAGSTYTVTITPGEVGITVANGTDTQAGSDDTIFYADSNVAVWMQDGTVNILGQNTDGPQFLQPEGAITVTRTAEGVTVASGSDSLSFAAPAWAYVPFSSGSYGYFTDGTATDTNGKQIAAVGGGFAGVYAYNDITRYAGLGLQLQTVTEDGKLTGAYWEKPAAADSLSITPFDPGSITIQPLDPSILDPEPDVSIMSVPTPTYTDGDWGYDVIQVDGVDKAAIVSYSGAGGDIVVPATVGGYDVYRLGKTEPSTYSPNQVFDNSSLSSNSTLTLSEGIVQIGCGITASNTKIVSLTTPSTLTIIGKNAFSNGTGLKTLSLSEGLLTVESSAFYQCSGLDGTLTLPNSITTIGASAFRECVGIDAWNLPVNVTTIDSSAFQSVFGIAPVVVISENVTTIGSSAFNSAKANVLIIASESTPGSSAFAFASTSLTTVLDLSNTIDYSVNRYGIPNAATVETSIGDSVGYIGVAYVEGANPLGDGATAILMAVPVLVIFALIVAALVIFLKRSY